MHSLVKICGLANEHDVIQTLELGPDAVGFILWPNSPRGVTPKQVAAWTNGRMPEGVRKVGVFVDTPVEEMVCIASEIELDVLQLHGEYTAKDIEVMTLPVWRVLHADRLPPDWNEVPVEALLLDSGTVEMPGGTGIRVDTNRAKEIIRQSKFPVLLAGGLKAGNVSSVIQHVVPAGVDVSSGVEAEPGRKDMAAVKAFLQNARSAFKGS
jgi:phosphoribosylanthranilate isomerase